MPEQITKHPEVTLKVLKGAGARCGEGVQPKILTKCPAERFCSLPSGEICVYGIADIPKMTQITTKELAGVVCPRPAAEASFSPGMESVLLAGAALLLGCAATQPSRLGIERFRDCVATTLPPLPGWTISHVTHGLRRGCTFYRRFAA
jgi:hypothetical protein